MKTTGELRQESSPGVTITGNDWHYTFPKSLIRLHNEYNSIVCNVKVKIQLCICIVISLHKAKSNGKDNDSAVNKHNRV